MEISGAEPGKMCMDHSEYAHPADDLSNVRQVMGGQHPVSNDTLEALLTACEEETVLNFWNQCFDTVDELVNAINAKPFATRLNLRFTQVKNMNNYSELLMRVWDGCGLADNTRITQLSLGGWCFKLENLILPVSLERLYVSFSAESSVVIRHVKQKTVSNRTNLKEVCLTSGYVNVSSKEGEKSKKSIMPILVMDDFFYPSSLGFLTIDGFRFQAEQLASSLICVNMDKLDFSIKNSVYSGSIKSLVGKQRKKQKKLLG